MRTFSAELGKETVTDETVSKPTLLSVERRLSEAVKLGGGVSVRVKA